MKRFFTFVSAAMLAFSLQAAVFDTIQVDGIYYQLNPETQTATLIRYNASSKYEIDDIVIPVSVSKEETVYPVVALGQGALRNTTAKTITFAKGSQVTELGMQAFQAAVNVEQIELPEGIKLIPMTCFNNATASNPTKTKKIVLPASIDSIARLSFSLPQLELLEFKGAVPPRINAVLQASGYTQNPWEVSAGHANNTAKSAVVLVPKGAVEAYRNTAWIGDYFDIIIDALKDTIQVDGLYYELNNIAQTATLIRLNTSWKYEIDDIVIPVSVSKNGQDYPVVALGQGALRNTTAKTITFAEGSKVTELGMQAFQAAINVQELELPEGIKLIPLSSIHNASASNPMTMKKLVLPASVDSIARLSICLPQLKVLEFKGAIPPRINTFATASGYTQNPWEVNKDNACNTAKTAVVLVPKGAVEAYRNTEWIGDYFNVIVDAPKDTIQVDGLYYELDNLAQTATLIRLNANWKYEIENIVIPVSVSKDGRDFPVVALGQGALRNATAQTITFAEGSQVTELGMQAFQAAVNVQELELPEGIKLIPLTCIHNATATNPMTMKKLILPSTVDSLALFSICLPQLDTLEFKGEVPPSIATKETATWTQNPWQISTTNACNTNKEAIVIVPKGSLQVYQNTAWIGDYFTTIKEKDETPTAVDHITDNIFRSGVYTITGCYLGEDATNLPKGMYIINGQKVIR